VDRRNIARGYLWNLRNLWYRAYTSNKSLTASKQDRTLCVKQPRVTQYIEKEEQYVHINARNTPTNKSHNIPPNHYPGYSKDGQWRVVGVRREAKIDLTRSQFENSQRLTIAG